MRAAAWAITALALGSAACTRLPEIGGNECGNGVIEPPEDCDTFGDDAGAACRPQGAVGECHLDCSAEVAGARACPTGWACDLGAICRRPTGRFDGPREFEVGTAFALASADFDGDERTDVASFEPPDAFGVTRIKFHYFDELGALDDTRTFPHALLSPAIANISDDRRADVVFSDERIGVLLGRTDRSWVPETFSSFRVRGTAIRTLPVRDDVVQDSSGFLVIADFDAGPGVYAPEEFPRLIGALPDPIDALLGDPVGAAIIEGAPCRQGLLARRGQDRFLMIDACVVAPDGSAVWRPEMISLEVRLEPPEPIEVPPLIGDVNSDGHLDVLVGSDARAFVAYGDGQTLATAVPLRLPRSSVGDAGAGVGDAGLEDVAMPLAIGDLTGDGLADFVLSDGLLLSSASTAAGQNEYTPVFGVAVSRWTDAVIADFNGNGHPDVIAGTRERPGLAFYNGTGTADLTFFSIPTNRPVEHLNAGDFDGDLIEDIAFSQEGGIDRGETQVMIAFGAPFGPPLPAVAVARLSNVEQMATYRQARLSHLLIASTEAAGAETDGVLTLLTGSGDRMPVALYDLVTFTSDGSVNGSSAVRVFTGAFTGGEAEDVLALGFDATLVGSELDFWLLPSRPTTLGTPTRLTGNLPSDVTPVHPGGLGLSLAGASADIDGDGRDEVLLAMPAQDADHCALLIYGVELDRLTERGRLVTDDPCVSIELVPVFADTDTRVDIAWLTGRADGTDRQLSIFWNDGAGNFSAEQRSIVSDRAASPRTFALLPGNAARGTSIAYATPFALELVGIDGARRALGEPTVQFEIEGTTGMTAADLNGDGAIDLALAARGNLNVLEAVLEAL